MVYWDNKKRLDSFESSLFKFKYYCNYPARIITLLLSTSITPPLTLKDFSPSEVVNVISPSFKEEISGA